MNRAGWILLAAFLCCYGTGCNKASDPGSATAGGAAPGSAAGGGATTAEGAELAAASTTPSDAVSNFLNAVRGGNEKVAELMLTKVAREEMAKRELTVQPPGSPSAQFSIGQTEIVTEQQDGAHVHSTWTDTDPQGQTNTNEIIWILRKEDQGWRIAGMATQLFEDQIPLILNFEDPEEMISRVEEADREMARRSEEGIRQAAQPPAPTQPDTATFPR